MSNSPCHFTMNLGGKLIDLSIPSVMGIINVTDDSFYAESRCQTLSEIEACVRRMVTEGADILDIGACSTRPGSHAVNTATELQRLRMALGVIRPLFPELPISIDTFRADVVQAIVAEFGAVIVNDISGGTIDHQVFETVARLNVPYILSHIKGNPETMMREARYGDLLGDLVLYFSEKIRHLRKLGIHDLLIDPGFGFAKNTPQNYHLLAHLDELQLLDLPVVVGISRKRMIYDTLQCTPQESLNGCTAAHTLALTKGAALLRVHDIKAAKEAITIYNTYISAV